MTSTLSPKMQAAADMLASAGALVRYPGGFWSMPDAPGRRADARIFVPAVWFGAQTVDALVARGLAQRVGRFRVTTPSAV